MSKVDEFLQKLAGETTPDQETGVDQAIFEKLANQNETIECATTLGLAADYLTKIAEEKKDELLGECAEGLSEASSSLMVGLNKIAAECQADAITDMVSTQDSLSKIASVLNALAADAKDENMTKIAEDVTEINNTLFDELTELAQKDESVASYLAEFHKDTK